MAARVNERKEDEAKDDEDNMVDDEQVTLPRFGRPLRAKSFVSRAHWLA